MDAGARPVGRRRRRGGAGGGCPRRRSPVAVGPITVPEIGRSAETRGRRIASNAKTRSPVGVREGYPGNGPTALARRIWRQGRPIPADPDHPVRRWAARRHLCPAFRALPPGAPVVAVEGGGVDLPAPRVAPRGRRGWRDQGRDDRQRIVPSRLAAAHLEQEAPRDSGEPVPRSRRSPPGRARAGHVADRLRCSEPTTPCTWTSRCAATGSCRRTGSSGTSRAASSWITSGSPTNSNALSRPIPRAVAAASAERPEGDRAPHRQKAHRGHTLPGGRGEPHRPCAPPTGRSGRLGHLQRVEIPIDPQVEDGREEFGPRSMGLMSL